MKKLILFIAGLYPCVLFAQVNPQTPGLSNAAAKALPAVVRIDAFISDSLMNMHPELATMTSKKTPLRAREYLLAALRA